ncbi:chemotaxis protein CheW [Bacillus sp. FJAT-18017]|uniref:chemotaxis protein CheW n=1 Tax=Bacillus sp. FJAT-18017 TaxID=1705566 RepID=UPI0006AE9F0C|nr:chemotaxis protein CheW [Bacillus sp. FJAT-18017]ALC92281.1 chemotaxis protein CheW [Bacillus sp. FJAT-18017]
MAQIIEEEFEDSLADKFLTFNLENEFYGIDIRHVIEIIGIQQITEVPEMPEYIRGIINLRGKIIPVMDVRARFKKQPKEYNDRTCIIVIEVHEVSVGLIVDSVSEVLTISPENIVLPPDISQGINRYVKGIGKVGDDVKLLLNCDTLLHEDIAEQIGHI